MISIQDLYAIRDIIKEHTDDYTRKYECMNLVDIIEQQIDANSKLEQLAEILISLNNPVINNILEEIVPPFESRLNWDSEDDK